MRRTAGEATAAAPRARRRLPPPAHAGQGTSMLETLVMLCVLGVLSLLAAPSFVAWRQQQRLEAAVRQIGLEMARACALATASGATHGLRLEASAGDLSWAVVADGDGDGISAADLDDGTDAAIDATSHLQARFPGVLPGRPPGVPTVGGGAPDQDGLAFGGARAVSCSADGGARSGTGYLRLPQGEATALRVYGPTARVSLWWWRQDAAAWVRLP